MKYLAAIAALISLVPAILGLTINTPTNVVQCQPVLLSWSGGTAPYYLSILPGGQPTAPALKTFDTQDGNSLTWKVDIAGNQPLTFALKDSTGAIAYSDIVTTQISTDSSCVNASVSASGSSGAAAATTVAGSTTPAASGSTSRTSGAASASKTAASASPSATTGKSNAASKASVATFGLAGLAGLVGIAIF